MDKYLCQTFCMHLILLPHAFICCNWLAISAPHQRISRPTRHALIFILFPTSSGTCCISYSELQWKLQTWYFDTVLGCNSWETSIVASGGLTSSLCTLTLYSIDIRHGIMSILLFWNLYVYDVDWKPNGARSFFNCFSISSRFFSGSISENTVQVFLLTF